MKKLFALLALAAAMLACTPEQVETAFKLAGGKVLVEVEVVDIINGGAYSGPVEIHFTRGGLDITNEFQTIVGSGPHAYQWPAAESQAVAAGDYGVIVKGDKLAKDYTSAFVFPEVLAGGEAIIKVVVPVGEPLNGWTVVSDDNGDPEDLDPQVAYLVNEGYPTHVYSYDGIDSWYYNNTEFAVPGTVDYQVWIVANILEKQDNGILGFEGLVDNACESLVEYFSYGPDDRTYEFTASAWSMWNVTQKILYTIFPTIVYAFKDADEDGEWDAGEERVDLGTFKLKAGQALVVEYHELPYPGAAGHYHYGHGHDAHGTMPNAGGGMSINE